MYKQGFNLICQQRIIITTLKKELNPATGYKLIGIDVTPAQVINH